MADIFELFKKIGSTTPTNAEPVSYIVVGLGNPGADYVNTRHNAGFMAVDHIAKKYSANINRAKYKALVCDVMISGKRVYLVKPQTYMNKSGESVVEIASFFKVPTENIIVICDDLNFAPGKMRIRKKGSHGGHNGLRNIIELLGDDAFPRIKLGIGNKPTPEYDLANWVLSRFTEDENKDLTKAIENTCDAVETIIMGKIDNAMAKYN